MQHQSGISFTILVDFVPPGTFLCSLSLELVGSFALRKFRYKWNILDWSPWEWQKGKGEKGRTDRQRNCHRNRFQNCNLSERKSPAKEKFGWKISWKIIGNFWNPARFFFIIKSIVKTQLMGTKSIFLNVQKFAEISPKTLKFKA